jgi:hypothetical protein
MKTIALAALACALALGSTSAVIAKDKSHSKGHEAAQQQDPREAYQSKRKGGWQSWCEVNPSCNGWGQYYQSGGKYKPVNSMVLSHI